MTDIGIEVGDLLRPRYSGMARYSSSLLAGLATQSVEVEGWAKWRRLPGWFLKPGNVRVRFFGATPPRRRPQLFHATACIFPEWKSPVEIATVHDLYAIQRPRQLSLEEIRYHAGYVTRADRIVCVSHFTRAQVHELLNVPESRTVAIPLAAGPDFVPAAEPVKLRLRQRLGLPDEFLLFVGRDRSNKNLDRLAAAYAVCGLDMPLCIVGRQSRRTRERLLAINLERGSIRFIGPIGDADLPVLLSCATALCMPSTFEGFGLPVIEAMACGTAVLTSAGRATEEAAGGNAVLVEPESIESIADGLRRVVAVTAAQCDAAREYATRRTWRDVAAETVQVYRDAGLSMRSPAPGSQTPSRARLAPDTPAP